MFVNVYIDSNTHLLTQSQVYPPSKSGQEIERKVTIRKERQLLAVRARTETIARPSDAKTATAASRFIGAFFCCAPCLHISRTLTEHHRVRRCRHHDHSASGSGAPENCSCALDLLA